MVSVDKLKEGWDVKNIGVIVAVRALASETLTEQILGRGLRLPFGERVGVPAIDQVDIVAHDSYRQLLAQKNALLQQVVPTEPQADAPVEGPAQPELPLEAIDTSTVQEIEEPGRLHMVGPTRLVDGQTMEGSELLVLASYDATQAQHERDEQATTKTLYKVEGAPSITFPRREREVLPVQFSLSQIRSADAQAEGAGFAHEFPVRLSRKALIAERDAQGNLAIYERTVQAEEATQRYVPVPEVRRDLEDRIWALGLVEQTLPELNAAQRIAGEFLAGAGVTDDDDEALWSERRAQQAEAAIAELIRANYSTRKLQPQYAFRPVEIPLRRPMPSDVRSRWDDFIKQRWYEGWEHSIQEVAAIDAKSTEFALASLFDASNSVQWWLRIYEPGEVWIERDNGRKYYPDFIVIDVDNVNWVVEGKSDHDARDVDVLAKKAAAEEWARYVRDDGRFGVWRYVFATETHIKRATSWEELLVRAKPER